MPKKCRIVLFFAAGTLGVLLLLALLVPQTDSTSSNRGWLDRVDYLYFKVKYALWKRGRGNGNSCIGNLKQIDGAKATWALENKKTNSDIPSATELYGATNYIQNVPECHAGGTYRIGRIDQRPRCSIPGHTI